MQRVKPKTPKARQVDSLITFDEYHRYDEIVRYVNDVAELEDWAQVVSIGSTFEGRDMVALELTKAGNNAVANVIIQAGV